MASTVRAGVHYTLYLDSLEFLGTAKHIPLIEAGMKIDSVGCFGLTELGHGSNVAKLGTTAHYIKETREFVINTPDSLSAKWWIGGAYSTASKCVVFAQLYVENVHKGLHPFVVDIRYIKNYKIKEGVIIGDCGPKSDNNEIDNGFIIFKNYKVPYDALLDKLSQITPEGKFVSSISKKEKRMGIMLSTLMRGRTSVISSSEGNLKNSLTIGIRYAAIRKQFGPPNSKEVSILDYQLTRNRLIPHLANLFGNMAGVEIIYTRFYNVRQKISVNPTCEEGTEYHAVLSVIKALTSE